MLSAQDVLNSVRANKTAITEQLLFAKRNFEVGTTTITDTHEAQARYDLSVAEELAAENTLDLKRSSLEQVIGRDSGALSALHSGVRLNAPEPALMSSWVHSSEVSNHAVVMARIHLEMAKRVISMNRAGHFPSLDLVAGVGRASNSAVPSLDVAGGTAISRSIGVQVTIPVFSGFAVSSKVREAIALEDKAENDLETAKRTAALEARQAFWGVTSGLAQIKALEAAEVSSQSSLESNKLGYQVGVRINIDVLNAQKQLYSTRQSLAQARYDAILQGFRLKMAAAILSETDLEQVNLLLH